MSNRRAMNTLGYVFVMIAIVFVLIASLSGLAAFFVYQRTPENGDIIRSLLTRCLLSFGLAVIAMASARNWLQR